MKFFLFFILSLISLQIYCQGYTLSIDKSQKYSYDYRVMNSTENEQALEYKTGDALSRVSVSDLNGDTAYINAILIIKRLDKDSIVFKQQVPGTCFIDLDTGRYIIQIASAALANFQTILEIRQGEYVDVKVKLAGPLIFTGYYHIKSKKELSYDEIKNIIQCMKDSRLAPSNICRDKEKYYITMEI